MVERDALIARVREYQERLAEASGKNVAAEKAGEISGFFRTRRARIIWGVWEEV